MKSTNSYSIRSFLLIVVFALGTFFSLAQNEQDSLLYQQKMEWFKEAKLGIFIHWGIYAVNGISESWSFFNNYISHEDYLKQTRGFTAKNYKPEDWARLIKNSGAKYAVITTKHHDGFALWKTKYGNLNSVRSSPAKRDLLEPFVKALRNENIKVGAYYSLPDWSYPDYTEFTRTKKRYQIQEDPKRWQRFLDYSYGQMKELRDQFNPDLWWFDGDWEHNAEEWGIDSIKTLLTQKNPAVIFNSRLRGKGDYATPEIGLPVYRPKDLYWELCMTSNDSWGFQQNDTNYKTPQQVIDIFVDCISKGGNLLLDIGPKADGTIPEEQSSLLTNLGKWKKKNAEAIYPVEAGIPYPHFYGPTALSKDKTILYLYVRDIPKDGKIALKGIHNKINRAYVVGNGVTLNHQVLSKPYWSSYPGLIYIDIPKASLDEYYTVVAVLLDGEIKLYKEQQGAIESN